MSDLGLLTDQILRDPGKPFRLGLVTGVDKSLRPPVMYVEGRAMRFLGSAADVQIGDTAVWGERGATPFVIGKLHGSTAPTDTWKKIGTSGSSFGAGWTNYSAVETGGGWAHGAFMKDQQGWVRLKGLVNRPVSGSQVIIGVLPPGYRPAATPAEFYTLSNDGTANIRIDSSGNIILVQPTPTDVRWISLFGLQFYVGPHGTNSDRYHELTPPGYMYGQNDYHIDSGVGMQVRDDGYVRCDGFSLIPSSSAQMLAQTPPGMFGLHTSLFGLYNWTGATHTYGRMDVAAGQISATTVTGGAGAALNWTDMFWWNSTKHDQWTGLSLQNSWVSFGGTYHTPSYYKDRESWVYLRGLMKNGTTTIGTLLATLPAGYRPITREMYPCYGIGVMYRIDILNNGQISIGNSWSAGSGFVSLDQVRFEAGTAI